MGIKIWNRIRTFLTCAVTVVMVTNGSAAFADSGDNKKSCSNVEREVEFNARPELVEDFSDVVNNQYTDGMPPEVFGNTYRTLSEFFRVNQTRAIVHVLNGEEVDIDEMEDYSAYCEDDVDMEVNRANLEGTVEVYNNMFVNGKLASLETWHSVINKAMANIKDNAASLTTGGLWLSNNGGYGSLKEASTRHAEEVLDLEAKLLNERATAVKKKNNKRVKEIDEILKSYGNGEFGKAWWLVIDKDEYNKTNKMVPREGATDILNNAACLPIIKSYIDTYLELANRLRDANRMIPILIPENCSGKTGGELVINTGYDFDDANNTLNVRQLRIPIDQKTLKKIIETKKA